MAGGKAVLSPGELGALLDEITRRLVEAAHPEKIILFGSYARGDFNGDSDIDLLVILSNVESKFDEMVRLQGVLRGLRAPIDVVVYSEHDVKEREHLRGTMLYHALKEGRVLYDAARTGS